jgi:hypothetical protein
MPARHHASGGRAIRATRPSSARKAATVAALVPIPCSSTQAVRVRARRAGDDEVRPGRRRRDGGRPGATVTVGEVVEVSGSSSTWAARTGRPARQALDDGWQQRTSRRWPGSVNCWPWWPIAAPAAFRAVGERTRARSVALRGPTSPSQAGSGVATFMRTNRMPRPNPAGTSFCRRQASVWVVGRRRAETGSRSTRRRGSTRAAGRGGRDRQFDRGLVSLEATAIRAVAPPAARRRAARDRPRPRPGTRCCSVPTAGRPTCRPDERAHPVLARPRSRFAQGAGASGVLASSLRSAANPGAPASPSRRTTRGQRVLGIRFEVPLERFADPDRTR